MSEHDPPTGLTRRRFVLATGTASAAVAVPSTATAAASQTGSAPYAESIDLCAAPYSATPGTDITTALQDAINWIAAAGADGEIYFSQPGTYNINGAVQTGTVDGTGGSSNYTYNGQILFPAVGTSANSYAIAIRIRGCTPLADGGATRMTSSGVILKSNLATAGAYVFDAIPSFSFAGANYPWTAVMPVFQDIVLQVPQNPVCGGVNAMTCMSFQCFRFVVQGGTSFPTSNWNGTTPGIVLPQTQNSGDIRLHCGVRGMGYGIQLSEHNLLDNVGIRECGVAFTAHKGGHACKFNYVNVEGTPTVFYIQSGQGLVLQGFIDWECVNATSVAFINQTVAGLIHGRIRLFSSSPLGGHGLISPVQTNSGVALDIENVNTVGGYLQAGGWQSLHPIDNFLRVASLTTAAPGLTWPTFHPWSVIQGSFAVSSQQLKSTGGTSHSQATLPTRNVGTESRTVTMVTTLASSSWHVQLEAHRVNGGTNNNHSIGVNLSGATATLTVNGTTRGQFTGLTLTGSTTYTVAIKLLTDQTGTPWQVCGYINGTLYVVYTLTSSEQTALAAGTYVPYIGDGVSMYEQSSVITSFTVGPAVADPAYVASGTAILSGGTIAVANTAVTANSIIRYNRTTASGTLGELSLALTAGAGFAIHSSSGTDGSTVYYEIVSY